MIKNLRYVVVALLAASVAACAATQMDANQAYGEASTAYASVQMSRDEAAEAKLALSKAHMGVFAKFSTMEKDYNCGNLKGLTKAQYDEMVTLEQATIDALTNAGNWIDTADTHLYSAQNYFVFSGPYDTAYAMGEWDECVSYCVMSVGNSSDADSATTSANGWITAGTSSNSDLLALLVGYGY